MDRVSDVRLSQLISHALRHHPDRYHIVLDEQGWVEIEDLTAGLNETLGYDLAVDEVLDIIIFLGEERYSIIGSKVRADYGHTLPIIIDRENVEPPEFLYHGTLPENIAGIKDKGLLKHNHQHVYLTSEASFAFEAGARRGKSFVIKVNASEAYKSGLKFYKATSIVWLAEDIPTKFLQFPEQ